MSIFSYGSDASAVALDGNTHFKIKEITGLSRIDTDLTSVTVPLRAGARDTTVRAKEREIVIYLRPLPNVRVSIYYILDLFRIGKTSDFSVDLGGEKKTISTIVKDVDIPRFDEPIIAVITLDCPYPYFRSESLTSVSLTPGAAVAVGDPGASEVGAQITITVPDTVTNFKIENVTTGAVMDIVGTFEQGLIAIRTEIDQKRITYFPAGDNPISSFAYLAPGSDWITLVPGTNSIKISSTSGTAFTATLAYRKEYI